MQEALLEEELQLFSGAEASEVGSSSHGSLAQDGLGLAPLVEEWLQGFVQLRQMYGHVSSAGCGGLRHTFHRREFPKLGPGLVTNSPEAM